MAGQKIYVVTMPEDIADIYQNYHTLTFDGYVRDMYAVFNISPEGIAKMYEPAPSKDGKTMALPS